MEYFYRNIHFFYIEKTGKEGIIESILNSIDSSNIIQTLSIEERMDYILNKIINELQKTK